MNADAARQNMRLPWALGQRGRQKTTQEMFNYVVLKVTNVHQVKVNEHDESEWNTRSHSFLGLLHTVNTFVIHFNFIYYSSNQIF